MATISITVNNAQLATVVDAMASVNNYQELIGGEPNPESKSDFARRMLVQYVREVCKAYKVSQSVETARVQALVDGEELADNVS
jgi:hypothetical protein